MTLQLPNKWVWDFWLVRDDMDYHAFYLQAPRALGDPERRHLNASVGHAASKDLRHWRILPDALSAGPPGVWDDRAVWTGCVVWGRGSWHMFYTGVSVEGDAVIGHARSSDLVRWETLPPLTEPGHFYALEVPQLVELGGRYYLLFSTWAEAHSAARRKETRLEPVGGTHYLVADDPLGPFRFSTHHFLVGDPLGSLYSGKLVEGPDGRTNFLAWRNFTPDGTFVGELADPFQVAVDGEGNLSVGRP